MLLLAGKCALLHVVNCATGTLEAVRQGAGGVHRRGAQAGSGQGAGGVHTRANLLRCC